MRQAKNIVKIVGKLSQIDLNEGTTMKNGKEDKTIGGKIHVRVNQEINGKEMELDIPVSVYSTQTTNAGNTNPSYASIKKVKDEFVSLAAVENEEDADVVVITSGQLQMNEYYPTPDRLVSIPTIRASFIDRANKNKYTSEAIFNVQLYVDDMIEVPVQGEDGEETSRFQLRGAVPQYNKLDLIPFYVLNEKVQNGLQQSWNVGDTVEAVGKLNFTSQEKKVLAGGELGFGEPVYTTRTIFASELLITGGSGTPLDVNLSYTQDEINEGKKERMTRLEEQKAKDLSRSSQKKAPSQTTVQDNDLGF